MEAEILADRRTPPERRYRPVARIFHWLVAVLVFMIWPIGFVIAFVKEDVKLDFYLVHESLGFLVLWLMLARLSIRLLNPPPPPPPMPRWQKLGGDVVHWLLYAALIVTPVFGFLATNAFGFPLQWFGLFPVPSPIGKSPMAANLLAIHTFLAWSILVLFALHVCGILYHHVIRRDATLERML